jgi:UDP-glucose 4-epimerase
MIVPQEANAELAESIADRVFCLVGGTGLIGSHLAARLEELGGRVILVSRRKDPGASFAWQSGDLDDPHFSLGAIPANATIFHLAGLKHVGNGRQNPQQYFDTNALGTWRLLEACRLARASRFVYASTGLVYGLPLELPIEESHPTAPVSIYGASKLAGEAAVRGYAEELNLPGVIARLSNTYSDTPDPDTIVGRIVRQTMTGQDLELRNLESERDYLHLDDAAEGLIRLAAVQGNESCLTVNLSTGIGTSAGQLARFVSEECDTLGLRRPAILESRQVSPERIFSLILSNQKLKQLTAWVPRITAREGMRRCLQIAVDSLNQ